MPAFPMANNSSASVISKDALIVWYGMSFFISLCGALAALLLIISMLRQKQLREGAHLLVIWILSLDILATIPSFLFVAAIVTYQLEYYVPFNCTAVQFFRHLLYTIIHWIAVALAFNRFIAILYPHRYAAITGTRLTVFFIASCFLVSIVVTIPFLTGTTGYYTFISYSVVPFCGLVQYPKPIVPFLLSLSVTVPFCLQGLFYLHVIGGILHPYKLQSAESSTKARQRTIAVMLIVSFIWYVICYCPLPIIATHFPTAWQGRPLLFLWLNSATHFGSAGTPFIYVALSAEYRMAVLKTARCVARNICGERVWSINHTAQEPTSGTATRPRTLPRSSQQISNKSAAES